MTIRNLFLLFISVLCSQLYAQIPNFVLEVNSPSTEAGNVPMVGPDGFGPSVFNPTSGDLIWASSGLDSLICDTLVTDLTGKIALIRRGSCDFTYKIYEAQQAGAVGAIIVNTPNSEDYFSISSGVNANSITIPSAMVTDSIAQNWTTLIDGGTPVNVTFKIPHVQNLKIYDSKSMPFEMRKPINRLGFDLIVPNTYTYTMNGTLYYRVTQPNNTIVNGTASYSINTNTQGSYVTTLSNPIYPNTVGEYIVEMWSSAAVGDTVRNTFTISDHIYSYVDTEVEPKHYQFSSNGFSTPDINGNTQTHNIGIILKTNSTNIAPDSLLVSWGIYNSNEFVDKTFDIHIYEQPSNGFSSATNYQGLNSIASTSYTIQPSDTVDKYNLIQVKLTSDIWSTDNIVFDQNKEYLLLIESPKNDTTIVNPPAFFHQASNGFVGTNTYGTRNTVVFTNQLYIDGWNNGNQAYIVANFAGCNDNEVSYSTSYFCHGDTLTLGTSQFTETELDLLVTYEDASSDGCDSIVIMDLIWHPEVDTNFINYTICDGDIFTFYGTPLSTPGIYEHVLTNGNGCDSIVHLDLTVNPTNDTYITETLCEGEGYSIGTSNYYSSGNYTYNHLNMYGCDSTIHLDLTILPTHDVNLTESICEGDSVVIGNEVYNSTGVHTTVFENTYGCDSTVYLDLTVHSFDTTYLTEEICFGDEFIVGATTYQTTGSYTETLTNVNGCDSTVLLDLTVNILDTTYLTEVLCEGEVFTVGPNNYNSTGTYSYVLNNTNGCDSTVFLDLTVNPVDTTYLTEVICQGQNVMVGTDTYTTTGNYTNILTNMYGCDSTVLLNLTVNSVDSTYLNESICQGDTFIVGNVSYTTTGTHTEVLSNMYGCDSTVFLNLTVNPLDTTYLTEVICAGEEVVIGTMVYNTSGDYINQFTNQYGCDSTVHLNLTVNPIDTTYTSVEMCDGDLFTIDTFDLQIGGNYTYLLENMYGCDSVVHLELTVHPHLTTFLTEEICEDDEFTIGNSTYNSTGNYTEILSDVNGCDSIIQLDLTVHSIDETITINQLSLISNQYSASYQWLTCPDYNVIQGADQQTFNPLLDGEYAVEITYNGCIDTSNCIVFSGIGIEEDQNGTLGIFPNPFQSSLEIELNQTTGENKHIVIYNDLGQKMYEETTDELKHIVNTTSFEKGIYLVRIIDQSSIYTYKVIKK